MEEVGTHLPQNDGFRPDSSRLSILFGQSRPLSSEEIILILRGFLAIVKINHCLAILFWVKFFLQ